MTIASQGYKGSVDEKGWSRLHASIAPWVTSGFGVSAVANARQVSVDVGVAEAYGVEVASDAAVPSPVFPAPANGQWYLVALERNWDPAVRASSVVFLTGPTVGTSAAPQVVPTNMPAAFANTPGTKSHQPLAWAFVSSASTTVTLFDLRLNRTGGGNLLAPSLTAACVAAIAGLIVNGARLEVASHPLPTDTSYGVARAHLVMRDDGKLCPATGTSVAGYGESTAIGARGVRALGTAVGAMVANYPSAFAWNEGDLVRCFSGEARFTSRNGNHWQLWNADNIDPSQAWAMQGDVGFDNGGGATTIQVVNGAVIIGLAIYSNNVRASGNYWGNLVADLRPVYDTHASGRVYSGLDNGAQNIGTLRLDSAGGLYMGTFAAQIGRANAWTGQWSHRIAQ